jgi:hypothetical protein
MSMNVFAAGECPPGMSRLDCESIYGNWTDWVPNLCAANATDTSGAGPTGGDSGSNIDVTAYPHIKAAFQFLVAAGTNPFTPAQAAGIVGNLMTESTPSIDPRNIGDNGTSVGIAQWHLGRKTDMLNWVGQWAVKVVADPVQLKQYPDAQDGSYSFTGQLFYLMHDLNTESISVRDGMKQITSAEAAADYWDSKYERSDGKKRTEREDNASKVLAAALANNWATDAPVISLPQESSAPGVTLVNTTATAACNNNQPGTRIGTNCASLGLTSESHHPDKNPYVCANHDMICPAGTDAGIGKGYAEGKEYDIRLCKVQGITVNAFVAVNLDTMLTQSKAPPCNSGNVHPAAVCGLGKVLTGGAFRTMSAQQDLWEASNHGTKWPVARPGYSNHQMGLAIDFDGIAIQDHQNPKFIWLKDHANPLGFFNLPSESWHWSVDGG